jgi:hypothetical protein
VNRWRSPHSPLPCAHGLSSAPGHKVHARLGTGGPARAIARRGPVVPLVVVLAIGDDVKGKHLLQLL